MTIEELQERLQQLNEQALDIRSKAEADKRDLSSEESEKLDAVLASFDRVKADIDRLTKLEEQTTLLNKGTGRVTEPPPPAKIEVTDDGDVQRLQTKNGKTEIRSLGYTQTRDGGFKSLGLMAWHVRQACIEGGKVDGRLERLASATTYGNESAGPDGGYAVPPDFRAAIMELVLGEDTLLGRCDTIPVSGNTFTCPADETTAWGTDGIQAYWDSEAVAATQSKPALQERSVKLNKVRALVPMTEELLQDATAMDAYLRRKAPDVIGFKVNLAILQGTGVGQPLGIINAPGTVSVAKESSQVADTVIAMNIIKMYSRLWVAARANAVWLINQDVEPQLYKLSLPGTDNDGNFTTNFGGLVYMPPGGLSASPYGTLFGKPVIPTQACETLGDVGDVVLGDLKQYLAPIKSGINPKVDTSMHLWFDQDLTAFKFTLRVGGIPWRSTTIAARDGSNTYGHFVTLAAR